MPEASEGALREVRLGSPRRREAGGERGLQLVGVDPSVQILRRRPAGSALDRGETPLEAKRSLDGLVAGGGQDPLRLGEDSLDLTVATELELRVGQPEVAVEVPLALRLGGGPLPLDRYLPRIPVRPRRFGEPAELDEDVGRHVQRVGRGGDPAIAKRRPQAEGGMDRIVVRVDEVVQHAVMVRVAGKHRLEERRGLHGSAEVVAELDRRQPCQRGQRNDVRIVRPPRRGGRHLVRVASTKLFTVALAYEGLQGQEKRPLALVSRQLEAPRRVVGQALEGGASSPDIDTPPEGVVVAEGLTPEPENPGRVGALDLLEEPGRALVVEVVKGLERLGQAVILRQGGRGAGPEPDGKVTESR